MDPGYRRAAVTQVTFYADGNGAGKLDTHDVRDVGLGAVGLLDPRGSRPEWKRLGHLASKVPPPVAHLVNGRSRPGGPSWWGRLHRLPSEAFEGVEGTAALVGAAGQLRDR